MQIYGWNKRKFRLYIGCNISSRRTLLSKSENMGKVQLERKEDAWADPGMFLSGGGGGSRST